MNPNAAKPNIVVLGGGFAGLETAYALRHALPDRADITLVSNRRSFLFRPHTIYLPFGMDENQLLVDIAQPALRKGIRFIEANVREIDPVKRAVDWEGSGAAQTELYDYLVIATGAKARIEEIPGLAEHGHLLGAAADMVRLRAGLDKLIEQAGRGRDQQIVLALPPDAPYVTPLYEMALMIEHHLREARVRERVSITFATCEMSLIESFGPLLHDLMLERFAERGIACETGVVLEKVEAGAAHFSNRAALPYDLLLASPPAGASVLFPALPAGPGGYLTTKLATRRVDGLDEVFAAGDTSDFPVKQAFLALLQADAIAEGIAADVQGRLPRFVFEPVSKFVLEEFDTGLYAQAPFTANDGLRVEVDSPDYRAGASPLWRIGKRMLGTALPKRFSQGEPFNAGLPSAGLDLSVKILSGVAARHRREMTSAH